MEHLHISMGVIIQNHLLQRADHGKKGRTDGGVIEVEADMGLIPVPARRRRSFARKVQIRRLERKETGVTASIGARIRTVLMGIILLERKFFSKTASQPAGFQWVQNRKKDSAHSGKLKNKNKKEDSSASNVGTWVEINEHAECTVNKGG